MRSYSKSGEKDVRVRVEKRVKNKRRGEKHGEGGEREKMRRKNGKRSQWGVKAM